MHYVCNTDLLFIFKNKKDKGVLNGLVKLRKRSILICNILGGMATMVATKYRIILKEIKEVAEKYHEASKDGKISKQEQQAIAKECMDVIVAIGKLVWKF